MIRYFAHSKAYDGNLLLSENFLVRKKIENHCKITVEGG